MSNKFKIYQPDKVNKKPFQKKNLLLIYFEFILS